MLPGGFKKDSRVWLHKNSKTTFKNRKQTNGVLDQFMTPMLGSDDPYELQLPLNPDLENNRVITDGCGNICKKDSRTWLHKSSSKKATRRCQNGPNETVVGYKTTMKPLMEEVRPNHQFSECDLSDAVIRTRSSTELIRPDLGNNKTKKKRSAVVITKNTLSPTMEMKNAKTTIHNHNSPHSGYGTSFHGMDAARVWQCEVAAYASDFCISKKEHQKQIAVSDSDSDEDSVHDEEHIPNFTHDIRDEKYEGAQTKATYLQRSTACLPSTITSENTETKRAEIGERGSVARVRKRWRDTAAELRKDGLQELEKMMSEQRRRRSLRLAKRERDLDLSEASNDSMSSSSRVSLEASVNLSEDLNNKDNEVDAQGVISADQCSQSQSFVHTPK